MSTSGSAALGTAGATAPPRSNGELVFAEPWESRAFALAAALVERGLVTWDGFRTHLVARIAAWEALDRPAAEYRYYRCWLEALEDVAADRGVASPAELDRRAAELRARPDGHDHHH